MNPVDPANAEAAPSATRPPAPEDAGTVERVVKAARDLIADPYGKRTSIDAAIVSLIKYDALAAALAALSRLDGDGA